MNPTTPDSGERAERPEPPRDWRTAPYVRSAGRELLSSETTIRLSLGQMLGLFAALSGLLWGIYGYAASRSDVEKVRQELREELRDTRRDLKDEIWRSGGKGSLPEHSQADRMREQPKNEAGEPVRVAAETTERLKAAHPPVETSERRRASRSPTERSLEDESAYDPVIERGLLSEHQKRP